jgi:hypothetical protein
MSFRVSAAPGVDWKAEREWIDLAEVLTRYLGPPPGRRGERGKNRWWLCPFHDDRNPSLSVTPGKPWWRCWTCGERGDAAKFVMRYEGKSFPEAIGTLLGGTVPSRSPAPRKPPGKPTAKTPTEPSGLPEADALALAEAAEARLWTPEGAEALAYLTGPRCLTPETIRGARLGWTPLVMARTKDGRPYRARGIVIPWFDRGRLALVRVRQREGAQRKYKQVFRHPDCLACYPSPETVRPGCPLVVVEGELDSLCLGQELAELASVVTLGSASARPTTDLLSRFLSASPWFVATDRDTAGDKAADEWPARARRVRPPEPFKDWTEAKQGRVNLRRWWSDILGRIERPPRFSWGELSTWRWGPALTDGGEPGIVIDRHARARFEQKAARGLWSSIAPGDIERLVRATRQLD